MKSNVHFPYFTSAHNSKLIRQSTTDTVTLNTKNARNLLELKFNSNSYYNSTAKMYHAESWLPRSLGEFQPEKTGNVLWGHLGVGEGRHCKTFKLLRVIFSEVIKQTKGASIYQNWPVGLVISFQTAKI